MARLPAYVLERLKFLVVDDDVHMRELVIAILNSFGVKEIAQAEEGASALEKLRTFPADVVVADWLMAPVDGLEFTRVLRSAPDSPNPFVPVIMLTAHTEIWRVVQARDSGVNEFLAKPVSAKRLYARICSVIDKPRQFVKAARFAGPDRRRRRDPYQAQGRRESDAAVTNANDGVQVDQDQIDKMFENL